MRFSAEFIEATREAQGDEAANQLVQANHEDTQRALTAQAATAAAYPRVARAARLNAFAVPLGMDEAGFEAFMAAEEARYTTLGMPAEDAPPPPLTPPVETPPPPSPASALAMPPGAAAWAPGIPGITPPEEAVVDAEIRTLMEAEGMAPGHRADLERRQKLTAALEFANQQPNGIAIVEGIRAEYESPPMYSV